jgi:DNA gyrase subunit B
MNDQPEQVENTASAVDPGLLGGEYTVEEMKLLQDAAHIRHRPGMYVGNTSTSGLHHLVYELVHNSIDEALAGYCNNITVRIHVDGSGSVEDDGRGIPVDMHPEHKKTALELAMTKVGYGGKFENKAYKVSAGLHGMGAKAVVALSEWTEARVRRNGRTYQQLYERGYATSEVTDIGASTHTGTTISFRPDPQIFHEATFDFELLSDRLRELAYLNRGVNIRLVDERVNKEEKFHFEGGLAQFVEYLNQGEQVDHKPISFHKTVDGIRVEVALQYSSNETEQVRCYANNTFNPVGGTHLTGFRNALTRTLGGYGEKNDFFKGDDKPEGVDYREGLTAVVSVQLPNPHFESQTKVRLNNPEVESAVSSVTSEFLSTYLEEHPKEAGVLMQKVLLAMKAREAASAAKKALKDRKNILNSGGLPGKLLDCTTRDRDASELFLVEGNSAAGSADTGRDREFQAILPLRGKVLNVEKAQIEKLLNNTEITSIISAVGIDIGNVEDISNLRYGKIVILTDADVDGQHIRTLLLTFFFRQMRKLVEEGHIFMARPPLYSVTQKKSIRYVQTVEEMQKELMQRGLSDTKLAVQKPGAPATRVLEGPDLERLVQVLGDLEGRLQILERRGLSLSAFLGKATERGLPHFHVILAGKEHWFYTQAEVDQFRQTEQQRLGHELIVADSGIAPKPSSNGHANGNGNGHADPHAVTFFLQELHEIRDVNHFLGKLREFGLDAADLVPLPRIAGREPPVRFVLEHDDTKKPLLQLRELVVEIRRLGERGLAVTRFKGLGEMNGEQLWETTLDPAKRSLKRVTLEDALKADQIFRMLMGEKVDPRKEFIMKHAFEVKEIDYHGA